MHTPTPGLPEFDYIKPASLVEASQFLAQHSGDSRPFMGGTDTFVRMRDGIWHEKYLVDVKNLDGMDDIRPDIGQVADDGPDRSAGVVDRRQGAVLDPLPGGADRLGGRQRGQTGRGRRRRSSSGTRAQTSAKPAIARA